MLGPCRLPLVFFASKSYNIQVVSLVDQRPQPPSSSLTHNDVNYGAHRQGALSCVGSLQSVGLFWPLITGSSIMHSNLRIIFPSPYMGLSLSHLELIL